ncbi:MAG: histidinol phosphatase, partial [Pseudonocardia sp.]
LVARALAGRPALLVMDEPTNHLDVRYQLELLALVRELRIPSLVALHDLNLAAAHCHRIVLLDRGREFATGTPEQILTADRIRAVYGVDATVVPHPESGSPLIALALARR